uniref:Si:ch73-21k16.5 n=1 Tax=Cyprinus carpio TaxID=7962 RepID=A0A8C2H4V6_CYPCA
MSPECVCKVLAQNTTQIIFYSLFNLPLLWYEPKCAIFVFVPLNANEMVLLAPFSEEGRASKPNAPVGTPSTRAGNCYRRTRRLPRATKLIFNVTVGGKIPVTSYFECKMQLNVVMSKHKHKTTCIQAVIVNYFSTHLYPNLFMVLSLTALMGMKLIGEIFRRSGAFFIRRAIGSDKLYWAVLSEYVRTIVRTGYAPLEFYVEGLRSRTLKSLTPKLGMMHMVLEPFFKGEVFDISLVPISISYERVLEESLLAHELLGVPKPKETTEALLKARTVLKEDYGCMHVCFGNPVSVRDLVKGKINRRQYNLVPRDLPMKPSKETQEFVSGLAHMIIRLQERNVVLSAWNLMAVVLLQNLQGIDLDLLTHKTLGLRRLALRFGAHLRWPKNVSDSEVMSSSVSLHHSVVRCERGRVYLVEEAGPGPVTQEEAVFRRAAAVLMCASYRNQAVHVFTRPAIVAVAMRTAARNRTDDVFHHFKFLLELFSNEFVLIPGQAVQDFEEGCSLLQQSGVIGRSDEEIYVRDNGQETIIFLREILQPFIESYQLVFRYLCEESSQTFREKMFSNSIRSFIVKLFISGEVESYESLSSDLQKNVLSALLSMAAVTKTKVDDQNEFRVNKSAVKRIWDMLRYGWSPQISVNARL